MCPPNIIHSSESSPTEVFDSNKQPIGYEQITLSEKRRYEEEALQHLTMGTITEARASMESLKLTSRIKTITNRIESALKSDLKLSSICEEKCADKDTNKLSIGELWKRLAEKQSDL